ncbi:MAG: HAD family phosphatase [Deltaproteobacteria bacterium]|nr:HAD family phosphatase [Deltaproteobacteria bacterium]
MGSCSVDVVLFDFGGVLADEGFVDGLAAIAERYGKERSLLVETGFKAVRGTGWVVGKGTEKDFWRVVRDKTGISADDRELREEILSRFRPRTWIFEVVKELRLTGITVGILSDQTQWLDMLNEKYDFFKWFDHIFSSYHMGKSKQDESHFDDVAAKLNVEPQRILFVDDHKANCERARNRGMKTITYDDPAEFLKELEKYCPDVGGKFYNVFI